MRSGRIRMSAPRGKADVSATWPGSPVLADTADKVAPAERRRNIVIRNLARLNHCCGRRQPGESLLRVRPSKIVYQQYQPETVIRDFRNGIDSAPYGRYSPG